MNFTEITGKDHISPSQIEMALRCGLQYQFRYIEGIKSPPGFALVVGSGTHEGVACDLTSKVTTGDLASPDEIHEAAAGAVRKRFDTENVVLHGEQSEGAAIDLAVRLCDTHHVSHAPTLSPKDLELELRVSVDGFPVDFLGYADIVETTGTIRDTKTAGQKKPQTFADSSIQLTYYDWAYEAATGAALNGLFFDVIVKTKTPYVQIMPTVRTGADRDKFLGYAEYLIESVERGILHPAIPGQWWCSEKSCGYWNLCRYGRKEAN